MFSVSHAVLYLSSVVMLISVPAEMGRSASPAVFPVRISCFVFTCSVVCVALLLLPVKDACFTYRSLGVQGNGNLAASLGLLGGASIVDDGLVVCVLALNHDSSAGRSATRSMSCTYVGEVPVIATVSLGMVMEPQERERDVWRIYGEILHANNVQASGAELVDGLDRVGLGANGADLEASVSAYDFWSAAGTLQHASLPHDDGVCLTIEVRRKFLGGWKEVSRLASQSILPPRDMWSRAVAAIVKVCRGVE